MNMEAFWQQAVKTPYLSIEQYRSFMLTHSIAANPLFNSILRSDFSSSNVEKEIDQEISTIWGHGWYGCIINGRYFYS